MVILLNDKSLTSGLNVLVIGINYAPEPTGSAPYTSGLAEMLAEDGHRVEAYVGIPHYPSWRVLPSDKLRLRYSEHRKGVLVRRFRHFVPGKQTMLRRIAWELTFYFNSLTSKPLIRPDVVIASTPSLSGALLGVHFSKKFKVPLITIVQDVLGEAVTKSGLKVNARIGKIVGNVERLTFRKSGRVCIVSPNFRLYVARSKISLNHIVNFPNWTHISVSTKTREAARAEYGWAETEIILLHTGNMGLKQDLGNLIQTAKLFEGDHNLRFILCGDGNQRNELLELAVGVTKVEFLDPVSEFEYPNLLVGADFLMVNERDSVGDMSLPSKLTSYLSAGKPILAAVSESGACASELIKTDGAAIVVPPSRPDLLAAAIRNLIGSHEKVKQMSEAGVVYARKNLTKDKARQQISEILSELI